jgi:glycosyltransferase involved in cell wall biosynthesis
MKIFLPIGSFYPAQIGGPDNIMYWHAKALVKRGHEVWVATTDDGIGSDVATDKWLNTDYGKVIYVKTAIHYAPVKLFLASLKPLLSCEVIHLSAMYYPISWLLAPLAILLGKKIVWTPHGELDPDAMIYSKGRKQIVLKLIRWMSKRVVFHSTCDAETDYVRNQFGSDVRIIQMPYFMELTDTLHRTPENYWLYVGRIHPKKAIERLIEALPLVTTKKRLKIIGDHNNDYGNELVVLAKQLGCSDQVDFLGHKRGAEKYQLMANAYCMVMPSHTENFGIVVTEALTQGTPVIASLGTPWKILNDRQAGFWSSNEVKPLAETLNKMANLNDDTYAMYRANAAKLVEEFDIEKNIYKWEAIYQQLIRKQPLVDVQLKPSPVSELP